MIEILKNKKCKMCGNLIPNNRIYCSNKCKYSDNELNKCRVSKIKNDKNKQLVCNICKHTSKDINNLGGWAIKHLKEKHNINSISYKDYYTIEDIKEVKKWKCPECDWSTKDITNKSGCITIHIKKHCDDISYFYEKHSELTDNNIRRTAIYRQQLSNIECKICHKKLLFISNSHLKLHNITQKEYKEKYGEIIVSDSTKKLLEKCGGTKNYKYTSNAENEIKDFLIQNNIDIIQSYKKEGPEIDLYIESKKIGIEYDGLYWHSELNGKNNKYHVNKTDYYKNKGIKIIHIFEDEWKEKSDIIKSRLLNILGINNNNKIYARKCVIKALNNVEKNNFLNENHLQGSDKSCIFIGAFYLNELVSVMTFSSPRIALGQKNEFNNVFELSRFCSKLNYTVVGIFSKLLKYFINNFEVNKIYTYADRRFSDTNSNVYVKNGFTFSGITKPNYFYMKHYEKRIHRFNFIKSKILKIGGSKDYTEWENMQMLGYDRIWDCGHLKYELIIN